MNVILFTFAIKNKQKGVKLTILSFIHVVMRGKKTLKSRLIILNDVFWTYFILQALLLTAVHHHFPQRSQQLLIDSYLCHFLYPSSAPSPSIRMRFSTGVWLCYLDTCYPAQWTRRPGFHLHSALTILHSTHTNNLESLPLICSHCSADSCSSCTQLGQLPTPQKHPGPAPVERGPRAAGAPVLPTRYWTIWVMVSPTRF